MMIEMARLYSRFGHWAAEVATAVGAGSAEGGGKANWMFSDVLRQFSASTVAKRRQYAKRWIGALAILALAGCATVGGSGTLTKDSPPDVKREAVAARAQGRWDALIKGDLNAAYAYLSPATRATTPLDVYKAKHKVGLYRKIKVDSVDCESAVCTVKLTLTYDYKRRFKGIETPLVENWVIEDGQAWLVEAK
ncbi:MAG: hypothetical protein WCB48_17585 [Casimicrobiaceae bacterium]